MEKRKFQLFAGSASLELAQRMCEYDGCELGKVELFRFQDGEMQPRYNESIRGNEVFIVQSTHPPAEYFLELLLMIDGAKRASAHTITVVMPYFGYARQDRKDQPRVSFGAKLVANLLTAAGADRIVTMDLHAGQIQGFFDIPLDNLEASTIFVPFIRSLSLEPLVIASPDMGGVKRARFYANHLKAELVIVDKERIRPNEVKGMQLIGDVRGKHVVIVDDMIDTAGTLCSAAELIIERGALSVRAVATHPLLSGNAIQKIDNSPLAEVFVTDTIPISSNSIKIKVLSVAPIFAQALRKIYNFESISSLFLT
ncbi:MAG: ribose-phosphate pyrophosphokinase [Bacteroidia bacterium]|nr:ribose-phosphate pyrophosphokinase [Bacteroidia bacterium]MDW8157950.1 ribose-phosphate pyrophosphokinase [Bacteroidia bacterium]